MKNQFLQKATAKILIATTALSATLSLSSCGPSMQTLASAQSSNGNSSNGGSGPTNPTPSQTAWKTLSMNGTVQSTKALELDKVAKVLKLSLALPANVYLDGMSLNAPIPKLPGATLAIESQANGGSAIVLRVPLANLIRGVDFPPATRLPNGDPLPAVADGELPSESLSLNVAKNINATIYFAVQQLGVFVNIPAQFNPIQLGASFPIRNEDSTRTWGYFHIIPPKVAPATPAEGGLFISVQIPDDIARIIDDNL